MITQEKNKELQQLARELRHDIVDITLKAGGTHIGGGLSMLDILVVLYFEYLNFKVDNPQWKERDKVIVSKGHGAIGYVPVLAKCGFFERKLLDNFNKFKSPFGMHLDSKRISGCDASTGSLGHGLPMAVGYALGARVQKLNYQTYCIVGDGELNEGSNWEAAMSAAQFKLGNLTLFIDRNKHMIDGRVEDVMGIEPLADKWKAFNWNVLEIDGHNFMELSEAIDKSLDCKNQPTVIIANTIKGKGVDYMEDNTKWHYGSLDSEAAEEAHQSIDKMYEALNV